MRDYQGFHALLDDLEPPEVSIRRVRGDSDAELFEYMRVLWAKERAANAALTAELAALKARTCATCKHYTSWWPNSPRGSCFGFAKGLGCHRIARGFCDKWQPKEAADGND